MHVSLVLPVHNEEENITPLINEIESALLKLNLLYEIIVVDDGSTDQSINVIKEICLNNKKVKLIKFRRNFGQTAAMSAGIDHSKGDVIILMDSDRQNDPNDIPLLLKEIENGSDVVVGWRKNRKDDAIKRNLPSKIANWLIRKIGKVQVHDLGCSLKAFKKELISHVRLYGEMHRFIPLYTNAIGGKLTEVVVNHRPRVAGISKYGMIRTFKVLLDLVTVKFLLEYGTRPMYFFGVLSFSLLILGICSSIFLIIHKLANGISIIQSPLLIVTAVLVILSVNFIMMGLIAELLMRTYFESQKKPSYYLKETINL